MLTAIFILTAVADQTTVEKAFAATLESEPTHYLSSVIVRFDAKALDADRITVALPAGAVEFGNPPLASTVDGLLRRTWTEGADLMYLDFAPNALVYGMIRAKGRWYDVMRTGGKQSALAIVDLMDQNAQEP